MSRLLRTLFLVVALLTGLAPSVLNAQENIGSVDLQTTTGTSTVTDGLTYDNTIEAVTDFAGASGTGYTVISSAPNTFVQRNGTPNQSSVWYAINAGTGDLAGVNQSDYGTLLKSNNLLEGADNVFNNTSPPAPSQGNIERLDYTWNTQFTNLNQLAFAVFERGNATAHDAFTIAIVSGINPTTGAPTAYAGFLKVAAGWGGATNLRGDPTNQLLRYSNGDNITSLTNRSTLTSGDQNTQGVGGVVFKVSDFNLPAGTTVYGYSLMGNDVNPTTPSDLVDVTNTTVYPASTLNGDGGIDLAAINGMQIQYAPEPAIWAVFVAGGVMIAAVSVRKRRLHR